MNITGTYIQYYYICKRKLWLYLHEVQMETESDLVYEGKLIHENSYSTTRSDKFKEIELDGIKIDFYNSEEKVIHEIKKSKKMELSHEWQLKYYIYVFKKHGIEGVTGVIDYPELKKSKEIELNSLDEATLEKTIQEIHSLNTAYQCPEPIDKPFCKNCSYFDFCYIGEVEEN